MSIAQLTKPAQTLMIADCRLPLTGWPRTVGGVPNVIPRMAAANTCGWNTYCAGQPMDETWTRHNGGENICFVDGHAKWVNWHNIDTSMFYR